MRGAILSHDVKHLRSCGVVEFDRKGKHVGPPLPVTERVVQCLLRLQTHCDLADEEIGRVCERIRAFEADGIADV